MISHEYEVSLDRSSVASFDGRVLVIIVGWFEEIFGSS